MRRVGTELGEGCLVDRADFTVVEHQAPRREFPLPVAPLIAIEVAPADDQFAAPGRR